YEIKGLEEYYIKLNNERHVLYRILSERRAGTKYKRREILLSNYSLDIDRGFREKNTDRIEITSKDYVGDISKDTVFKDKIILGLDDTTAFKILKCIKDKSRTLDLGYIGENIVMSIFREPLARFISDKLSASENEIKILHKGVLKHGESAPDFEILYGSEIIGVVEVTLQTDLENAIKHLDFQIQKRLRSSSIRIGIGIILLYSHENPKKIQCFIFVAKRDNKKYSINKDIYFNYLGGV
ncbi:MAG: hypothetical protein J7K23_07210, partial [Thermoproteales archaeon]|nr:hypothetical protein [Thermoproteales archaeon]